MDLWTESGGLRCRLAELEKRSYGLAELLMWAGLYILMGIECMWLEAPARVSAPELHQY